MSGVTPALVIGKDESLTTSNLYLTPTICNHNNSKQNYFQSCPALNQTSWFSWPTRAGDGVSVLNSSRTYNLSSAMCNMGVEGICSPKTPSTVLKGDVFWMRNAHRKTLVLQTAAFLPSLISSILSVCTCGHNYCKLFQENLQLLGCLCTHRPQPHSYLDWAVLWWILV